MNNLSPEVSVVVPITERHDDLIKLHRIYAEELRKIKKTFEFIFIVESRFISACNDLEKLIEGSESVRIIKFSENFGESAALMEGFKNAKGEMILTLASYIQIKPEDLEKVFMAYEEGNDLVITRRYPRKDPFVNRVQSNAYHFMVRKLTGVKFKDITSGMRLINKKILSEIVLYGDLHRFIPIFAQQRGIKVKEVNVSQRKEDTGIRLVRPGVYVRRILDMLTLFFLVKFTKKPLRFFGLIGSFLIFIGFLITLYLGILRMAGQIGLKNHPLLLLGIILMVFGFQTFSVGLVGELIIYSHAKDLKDYHVEEIIE